MRNLKRKISSLLIASILLITFTSNSYASDISEVYNIIKTDWVNAVKEVTSMYSDVVIINKIKERNENYKIGYAPILTQIKSWTKKKSLSKEELSQAITDFKVVCNDYTNSYNDIKPLIKTYNAYNDEDINIEDFNAPNKIFPEGCWNKPMYNIISKVYSAYKKKTK